MLNNTQYEKSLYDKGMKYIAGVDEVGRGPLAGPLVVCAVILDLEKLFTLLKLTEDGVNYANTNTINDVAFENFKLYSQIDDSKKISDKNRRRIEERLRNEVLTYSITEISNEELDSTGISKATQKAFYNSVSSLKIPAQHVLTDMFPIKKIEPNMQTNIPKGDSVSITIGAASVLAKVYRDNLMIEFHKKYPEYGFDQHKGYGTTRHIQAIKNVGICPIHRRSFEPIKSLLKLENSRIKTN